MYCKDQSDKTNNKPINQQPAQALPVTPQKYFRVRGQRSEVKGHTESWPSFSVKGNTRDLI